MTDIRLERSVYASRDWVVYAWCDAALLAEWFCPDPSASVTAELDVSPNGYWKVSMGATVVKGEYTEVNLPERLAFTWRWEHEPEEPPTTVRVTFTERSEASTEVLLEHLDFTSDTAAQSQQEGWAASLDRLAQVVPSKMAGSSGLS